MLLYQKYAPKNLTEFAGNPSAVDEVKKWALLFENGKLQKPLLIYGPPGIGKTALAYALAGEMGWDMLELNASDTRNKKGVEKVMGMASSSSGLFSKHRLILIDEVDGLQGNADRGGMSAISTVIKNSSQPIILTANDAWDRRLVSLRSLCKFVEMRKVNKRTVFSVISRIAQKEKMNISEHTLNEISENCDGDLRSAIIDLQGYTPNSLRDRNNLVFDCIKKLFKADTYIDAVSSFDNSTLDHDLIKLWIEQNIANEYESYKEIADAYNYLSRADMFDGRIRRRQAWKLFKYSNAVMLAGVALSKHSKYHKFVKYEFPSYLRSMSLTSRQRAMRKSINRKISQSCHVSISDSQSYYILLKMMSKKGKSMHFFELDADEQKFINKL